MFAQQQDHPVTHFSGFITIIKECMTLFSLIVANWIIDHEDSCIIKYRKA